MLLKCYFFYCFKCILIFNVCVVLNDGHNTNVCLPPFTALVQVAHRSVPMCKTAPESSTTEQTAFCLQPCCHPQVNASVHTPSRFSPRSVCCKFRWASIYSLTAPFNTYEKYMLKSLPPLLSFCSSFILSPFLPLSSVIFQHLLLRVTVMNDTPQRITHPSVHPSLFPSSSHWPEASHPPSLLLISTVSHWEGGAENVLKSAPRNVLLSARWGV